MAEPRLYLDDVVALNVQLHYVHHEGWTVRIAHRHEFLLWSECPDEFYSELVALEAVQVVSDAMGAAIGTVGGSLGCVSS